jgi:UDP-N-acetylglucosamine--N-acetylmuramyl-(pentapeptide) pyrophosphoryl-undecaprenol N-acetylglucosamine transferase
VDEAFVGFPEASARLKAHKVFVTGTPVRAEFSTSQNPVGRDSVEPKFKECRTALGLDPNLPTVLVVGGSQGASGLNEMILSALPLLAEKNWQWLHLTGAKDFERVKSFYASQKIKAVVKPFLVEMDLALGAATACVSRSGASSLAEIAAMRLPSLLVPFPAAADNHQYFNALAFEKTGAADFYFQKKLPGQKAKDLISNLLAGLISKLVEDTDERAKKQSALAQWHAPKAAEQIAENILSAIVQQREKAAQLKVKKCGCGHAHGHAKHAH